jgi:integrase/recombinase XerD
LGALRRWRDRAMVEAMVLGGLRRCEVLGLRLEDLRPAERRVFIADGKGGHQRLVPISARFFASVARYLDAERPPEVTTDRVFVVLKGPRRGRALSEDGLDEIVRAARGRAGLSHATCHELRHTCLTRLREAGMALEGCRPRRVTGRSSRPASTCTWPTTGSPASTYVPSRRSTPQPPRR